MTEVVVVAVVMSRVNPRVGVVSGSEAETWDGGVGVPWLPCVHPLSHSSSGAEIRPLNSTASSSSVGPRPRRRHLLTASRPLSRVAPTSNRGGRAKVRRRLLALNLHLEREQETGDALSPSEEKASFLLLESFFFFSPLLSPYRPIRDFSSSPFLLLLLKHTFLGNFFSNGGGRRRRRPRLLFPPIFLLRGTHDLERRLPSPSFSPPSPSSPPIRS